MTKREEREQEGENRDYGGREGVGRGLAKKQGCMDGKRGREMDRWGGLE